MLWYELTWFFTWYFFWIEFILRIKTKMVDEHSVNVNLLTSSKTVNGDQRAQILPAQPKRLQHLPTRPPVDLGFHNLSYKVKEGSRSSEYFLFFIIFFFFLRILLLVFWWIVFFQVNFTNIFFVKFAFKTFFFFLISDDLWIRKNTF